MRLILPIAACALQKEREYRHGNAVLHCPGGLKIGPLHYYRDTVEDLAFSMKLWRYYELSLDATVDGRNPSQAVFGRRMSNPARHWKSCLRIVPASLRTDRSASVSASDPHRSIQKEEYHGKHPYGAHQRGNCP